MKANNNLGVRVNIVVMFLIERNTLASFRGTFIYVRGKTNFSVFLFDKE